MTGLLMSLWGRIPAPWRLPAGAVLFVLFCVLIGLLAGRIQSCGYDKGRAEFEQEKVKWTQEKNQLLGEIKVLRKELVALEAKDLALGEAAERGKKLDEAAQQNIENLTKEAADEASVIDQPADCHVRADRSRANLARLNPPIIVDADEWRKRLCPR